MRLQPEVMDCSEEILASILATTSYFLYKKISPDTQKQHNNRPTGKRTHEDKPTVPAAECKVVAYRKYRRTYTSNRSNEEFFDSVRMSIPIFDILLDMVGHRLEKYSIKNPADPEARLYLTLLHLSSGTSANILADQFNITPMTTRRIIIETCETLWDILSPRYLRLPHSVRVWEETARQYEKQWNMPNCVGALDAKFIMINCPASAGAGTYNSLKNTNMVLLSSCDANFLFTYIDIGIYGENPDEGIFSLSSLGQALKLEKLSLPSPRIIQKTLEPLPYFMVGNATFPLLRNLMRPYPGRLLDARKNQFNTHLSLAHKTIENAFGILAARWRILLIPIKMKPGNVEKIVKACVVLHNFLKLKDALYCPRSYGDYINKDDILVKGQWRQEVSGMESASGQGGNQSRGDAFKIRDILADTIFN